MNYARIERREAMTIKEIILSKCWSEELGFETMSYEMIDEIVSALKKIFEEMVGEDKKIEYYAYPSGLKVSSEKDEGYNQRGHEIRERIKGVMG